MPCTNNETKEKFKQVITKAKEEGNSVGGVVQVIVYNVPGGIGNHPDNSVEEIISKNIFKIPGVKGIEFGEGFRVATMKGSELNDAFVDETGKTATNHSGGIAGGLTNGNDLVFRVAMRPAASIGKPQQTFDFAKKEMTTLSIQGRHDTAIVLRTPVIFEAVTAIVLADFYLQEGK
jgi:chorismate synthase